MIIINILIGCGVLSLIGLIGLFCIFIYDRIRYGEIPVYKDDEE